MKIIPCEDKPIQIGKKIFRDNRVSLELLGFYCKLIYEYEKDGPSHLDITEEKMFELMDELVELGYADKTSEGFCMNEGY